MTDAGRGRRGTPERRAQRLAEHASETDPAVVLAAAARLLELRSRTVSDLRARLARAGYPALLVEGAVARLVELRLLDDEAYARGWLEARDNGRPRGEFALRRELRHRGVPADVTESAIEDRRQGAVDRDLPSADEVAAERLVARRAAALNRVADPRERRQRAYALLARNGFDPDVASRVAARVTAAPVDADALDAD